MSGQFILFRRSFPYSLERDLVSYACSAVLVALLIALIISWLNDSEISLLWLQAQDRVKLTRMGAYPPFLFCAHDTDELSLSVTPHVNPSQITLGLRERLFGHLLSEDDIRSGLIATGPEITPRRYPTVAFIAQHLAPSPNANAT